MATKSSESESSKDISKKLDVLIHLALKGQMTLPPGKKEFGNVVKTLYRLGIEDAGQISKIILANNSTSVANVLTKLRKGNKN